MTIRRVSARLIALTAAYALALQALFAAMSPAAQLAGVAPSALTVICASPTADQPAGDDRTPCTLHCLIAGCGFGGTAPPANGVAVIINPAEIRIALLQPLEMPGRATHKSPQIPRAPPRA